MSAAIGAVRVAVRRLALRRAPVVILGESGTGKEVVAQALHALGGGVWPGGPFFPLNAAALPSQLVEAQLFGWRRGAFTSADRDGHGAFELAGTGTLFLDEIGDMPLAVQPKLLRALETRKFRPLGAAEELPLRARVIVATSRDLREMVAERRFREDLYYRLAVSTIRVPSLRDRPEDIPLLAQVLAASCDPPVRLTPDALALLARERWPGNVRELRNRIEEAAAFTDARVLSARDVRCRVLEDERSGLAMAMSVSQRGPAAIPKPSYVEAWLVEDALQGTGGNKAAASRALGVSRRWLDRAVCRAVRVARTDDKPDSWRCVLTAAQKRAGMVTARPGAGRGSAESRYAGIQDGHDADEQLDAHGP